MKRIRSEEEEYAVTNRIHSDEAAPYDLKGKEVTLVE
jgi:hypothetical protein